MNGEVRFDRQCPINRKRQSESPTLHAFNDSYKRTCVHRHPPLSHTHTALSFRTFSDTHYAQRSATVSSTEGLGRLHRHGQDSILTLPLSNHMGHKLRRKMHVWKPREGRGSVCEGGGESEWVSEPMSGKWFPSRVGQFQPYYWNLLDSLQ